MASDWVNFAKYYSQKYGISYRQALKEAGPAYKKYLQGGYVVGTVPRNRPPSSYDQEQEFYELGYKLGDLMGGAKQKGLLTSLLSGLDARINIK